MCVYVWFVCEREILCLSVYMFGVCVCVCRLTLGVFFNLSPLHLSRQGLPMRPELIDSPAKPRDHRVRLLSTRITGVHRQSAF